MNELKNKFKTYIEKTNRKDIKQIAKDLNIQEYEVYGLIQLLKNEGLLFDIINGKVVKIKPERTDDVYVVPNNLDHMKLLLISDTHLASKYDRLDILRYLYDQADKQHVNYILHAGDVTDGLSNRPDHVHNLKETSYDGQRDYVIDKYPHSDIPTYMIAGNHDYMWVKQCGADIVKDICKSRQDLIYLGSDCEDLILGKTRIRLYHGKSGGSYAKSYKIQKYLDAIPLSERPDILQTGHIHQAFYMKQDKTHCFQTSCLQDLTPYERSNGFENDKSCWWVDVYTDNNGHPVKITQELETFGKRLIRRKV
jgi:predicted phosphodiesterase